NNFGYEDLAEDLLHSQSAVEEAVNAESAHHLESQHVLSGLEQMRHVHLKDVHAERVEVVGRDVSGEGSVHIGGYRTRASEIESRMFRHGGDVEAHAEIMRRGLVIHAGTLVADESALADGRVFAGP